MPLLKWKHHDPLYFILFLFNSFILFIIIIIIIIIYYFFLPLVNFKTKGIQSEKDCGDISILLFNKLLRKVNPTPSVLGNLQLKSINAKVVRIPTSCLKKKQN